MFGHSVSASEYLFFFRRFLCIFLIFHTLTLAKLYFLKSKSSVSIIPDSIFCRSVCISVVCFMGRSLSLYENLLKNNMKHVWSMGFDVCHEKHDNLHDR